MRDIVELIRGCLAAAQDPQRKYADLARKDREYEVGDQGQECQAIQILIETSQGRGVDLGIREPPGRKTTSMDQTRTAVRRRVRNAREFRRLFVHQPRQVQKKVVNLPSKSSSAPGCFHMKTRLASMVRFKQTARKFTGGDVEAYLRAQVV
ncbi:hypothetical protein AgCh_027780 [Apium graveolens]